VHEIDDIANRSVAELGLVAHQVLITVPPRMLTLLAFQASCLASDLRMHRFKQLTRRRQVAVLLQMYHD